MGTMKNNRILSTAGICLKNSTRLRSYCNLMQGSLLDKWLFADDFVESHVCFIRADYLANIDKDKLNRSQVIVIVADSFAVKPAGYEYQISVPLTAIKIRSVLNKISDKIEFKPLNLMIKEPEKAVNKFKAAFSKIRKNFFGKKGRDMLEIKQKSRQQFISRITQKIQLNKLPPYKIVLLGSPGSGKTTAIQSVGGAKALSSDVSATDSVASDKEKTTVGVDFAEIKITGLGVKSGRNIQLFGTPGQIKFNFVWDMVGKNTNAFIVLLDMSRPEPLSYLKFYKRFLSDELGNRSQIYCALTHCGRYSGDINSLIDCIACEFHWLKGVYKIDAREKDEVSIMLGDIYSQIKDVKYRNTTALSIQY